MSADERRRGIHFARGGPGRTGELIPSIRIFLSEKLVGLHRYSFAVSRIIGCVLGVFLCGVGCGKPATSTTAAPTAAPTAATNQVVGVPQPKLPTIKLWLGAKEIIAEMATTDPQRIMGMMFRTRMGEDEGMLFAFPRPHRTGFWMKNTLIPLSCAYIDSEGEILELHDMTPKNETPIMAGSDRIVYVLETTRGWFERNKIGVGTVVRTEYGALKDSFGRQR